VAGRANGTLAVALEQEDELRAFCSLVSRRAPHGNELAWALERFELGCERESPLQGLSDHLLALRALLEPEGYWSGMLPGRLAALCAMPADRGALLERASAAIELERSAIEGTASLDAAAKALADEIATHLKALLRDVICGHLSPDLAGFADDLLARELEGGEEAGADQAEGAASAAIAVKPRFTGEEPQAVNEEAQEADSEAEVQAAEDEQAQDGEPVVGPGRVRASARTPPAAVPSA
jgi:hypothetical protein